MRPRNSSLASVLALVAAFAWASPGASQESGFLKQTFPQLYDAIWDIPTLENSSKTALVAIFSTAVEMSRTEAARTLEEAFGLSLGDLLAGVAAEPKFATDLAIEKFGTGLAEDAAVSVASALLTDLILAGPLFEDIPPNYKLVLGAAMRALFEEGYGIWKGVSNPVELPELIYSGLVDRALDVYAIARESRAVANAERAAFVANAQSLETAATLAMLKTTRSGEVAMQTVRAAQDTLAAMVGNDDAEAVREIVNMGFIALLAQKRGDTERARSFAGQMLAIADKADNIAIYSPIYRPFDLLVAVSREEFRDSPSEAAFVIVSTTSLRLLYDASTDAADPPAATPDLAAPVEPVDLPASEPTAPAPVATGAWGADVVHAADIGYSPCQERNRDPGCLRDLGLTEQAIAFSFAVSEDYSGFGRAIEFRELGAVDLAVAEYIGASSWTMPILLNGTLDLKVVPHTSDLAGTFRDETSRAMLARYPEASSRDVIVTAHRILPDGTQRLVVVETLTDQCRACDYIGSAATFLEVGPATGGRLQSIPVGLHITGPGVFEDSRNPDYSQRPDLLQVRLNALGYPAGPMDGYPGPATRDALMAFQAEACLTPTGQPDSDTVAALATATGFDASCAGARVPDGITANSPLRSGTYVDDPALCQLTAVPMDRVFESQITLSDGGGVMWGYEDGCVTSRSDIRNGTTLFRGTCYAGNEQFLGSWTFDLTSNEAFVYLQPDNSAPPRSFTRCDDTSPLVTGAPASTADDAVDSELVTLLDGTYVTDLTLCGRLPTADTYRDVRVLWEGAADVGVGEFCTFGASPAEVGGILNYEAHCPFSEVDYVATWSWRPTSKSSFVEERGLFPDRAEAPWGLEFLRCAEPGESASADTSVVSKGSDDLSLPQGTFTVDPKFCPPIADADLAEWGDQVMAGTVTIDGGQFSVGEVLCDIHSFSPDGQSISLNLTCNEEGYYEERTRLLTGRTSTGFVMDEETFTLCDSARNAGTRATLGDDSDAASATARPILESPDLFNIFEAIMAGNCSGKQVCSVDGVDGSYALRALGPNELAPFQAVSLFQMIYEQGVPSGIPVSPDMVERAINDSRFMVRRGVCTANDCATAVMIVDASVIGSPAGASGEMGFALEMPAGWVPSLE